MSLNTVCWADVPVKNLDRAIAFYTAVLGSAVSKEGDGGFTFGLLPRRKRDRWFIFRSKAEWIPPLRKWKEIRAKLFHPSMPLDRTDSVPSLLIRKATRSRCILTQGDPFCVASSGDFSRQHGTIIALG